MSERTKTDLLLASPAIAGLVVILTILARHLVQS